MRSYTRMYLGCFHWTEDLNLYCLNSIHKIESLWDFFVYSFQSKLFYFCTHILHILVHVSPVCIWDLCEFGFGFRTILSFCILKSSFLHSAQTHEIWCSKNRMKIYTNIYHSHTRSACCIHWICLCVQMCKCTYMYEYTQAQYSLVIFAFLCCFFFHILEISSGICISIKKMFIQATLLGCIQRRKMKFDIVCFKCNLSG